MKVFFALLVLVSTTALASEFRPGSQCGLADYKDETWVEVGKTLNAGRLFPAEIHALPTITKQQLIIAARATAEGAQEEVEITDSVSAVKYLRPYDGPYVATYVFNRKKFTEVWTYPGDNTVGVIFKYGKTRIHAKDGDDSIVCR